jgi:hypothetical protein
MCVNKSDFSGADLPKQSPRWGLYLAVLLFHVLALASLNAVLTLNRLAAQAEQSFDVAILPQDAVAEKRLPKPAEPKPAEPKSTDEPTKTEPTTAEPQTPAPVALPPQEAASSLPVPQALPVTTPPLPAGHDLQALLAMTPEPVQLRYSVTKDGDSARASLIWRPSKEEKTGYTTHYELSYEATYFGISIIKQTSSGTLAAAGLAPTRFGEKRRGRSEQATHFDSAKNAVTFSNNRPEAKLAIGSQDRASFLIQLASLFAGQPDKFKAGQVIELPVASVDELEMWAFEVQANESLALPLGETQAIKLLRRPRRAFDQTVEVWLAPTLAYLPVRIRLTDSGGVTDSQLSSKD